MMVDMSVQEKIISAEETVLPIRKEKELKQTI